MFRVEQDPVVTGASQHFGHEPARERAPEPELLTALPEGAFEVVDREIHGRALSDGLYRASNSSRSKLAPLGTDAAADQGVEPSRTA